MRPFRFLSLLALFIICLLLDRHFLFLPLTWILCTFYLIRLRVSVIPILLGCVITDMLLAFPLGASAIIVALGIFCLRLSLGQRIIQGMYLGIIGILMASVYGLLLHTFSSLAILSTGLVCILLYTVDTSSPALQEIGDVQS